MRPCFCAELRHLVPDQLFLLLSQCGLVLYGLPRFIHLLRPMTKNFVSVDILFEKPPFTLQRTFFRRLSGQKLEKGKEKCAPSLWKTGAHSICGYVILENSKHSRCMCTRRFLPVGSIPNPSTNRGRQGGKFVGIP